MTDDDTRERLAEYLRLNPDATAAEVIGATGADPAEWFETIIREQILPNANTGDSELLLNDKDLADRNPRRFRLRLRHPDTTVSDLSLAYDAGEMEAYLRGLQHGLGGRIEQKSEHRECIVCGDDLGDRVGNYCSTDCAVQSRNE